MGANTRGAKRTAVRNQPKMFEVVELYCDKGMTFRQVGEEMGFSESNAHRLFKLGIEKLSAEADELLHTWRVRQLMDMEGALRVCKRIIAEAMPDDELERAREQLVDIEDDPDALMATLRGLRFEASRSKVLNAVDRIIRAHERISKLIGLDAPESMNLAFEPAVPPALAKFAGKTPDDMTPEELEEAMGELLKGKQ